MLDNADNQPTKKQLSTAVEAESSDNINNTNSGALLGQIKSGKLDEEIEEVSDVMNICQWIFTGALGIMTLLMYIFIIYISATWNKDRPNEYA
eukprot:CAMPEP_0116878434 /NCGR_PEP_ID=MMETSP0463-20121206/10193_1 /TAXON_ID=181622 /ORGANISM="Strombidinopsis sp, Strain SopsisLIS2011" /LENGTH=92 /DNA_ID=CAMNT_0004526669 /DNA_START=27 /DNA_END=305 /DNA_ORIENTATION=+